MNIRIPAFLRQLRPIFCTALLAGVCAPFAQAGDKGAEKWTPLFNGKNLSNFAFHLGKNGTKNEGTFTMKDGVIIVSGKPTGYMYTKKPYSKYILEYEWAFKRPKDLKNDKKFRGNSGCLIHIGKENALDIWPRSIEVQGMHNQACLILPIPRNLKCKKTDAPKARAKALKPVGEWQTTRIEVDGGNMKAYLNGTLVSTVTDCELTSGPIGFQSEGKEIHLRNIRILEKK
jgi:hypothetical protein